ncbi:hypothetical protein CPB85DRAFT_1306833 [Mucidula mucida]|nr:hypothetical protein CPB85DRAFT_1306833 [Mucidula mucida]
MTNQEINTFNEMFNMIFAAVSEQTKAVDNVELQQDDIGQLFSKLRRHSRRKWTTEEESDLDRKKEEMEQCDTDQQLLEWAMREMFDESVRQEAASRKAIQEARKWCGSAESTQTPVARIPPSPGFAHENIPRPLQRPASRVGHVRPCAQSLHRLLRLGCSTMAYNELIKTRWNCFRDLKGVHDALQEMSTNGVVLDKHTCKLVDDIVRDVGTRNLWTEEDPFGNSDEVWNLIHKMERLAARQRAKDQPKSATSKPKPKWDDWKSSDLTDIDEDIFGFDKWDTLPGRDRGGSASLSTH